MTFAKTSILASIALLAMTFNTNSTKADTYHHIDSLAVKMQAQTRELVNEFALHYRHNSGYYHLRSDALQLSRIASHIHSIAHYSGNVHHLRNDLEKADRLFHHLEGVLARTDSSYHGHNHGDTHHVFELMHDLEQNLHHLKDDIEELDEAAHHVPGHGIGHVPSHGPVPGPGLGLGHIGHGSSHYGGSYSRGQIGRPAFGYNWGNGGVYFNGNRWSIRLGL